MTQYVLAMYQPDGPVPEPEALGAIMQKMGALRAEMQEAGVWVFAARLQPPGSATVIQARGDELVVTDGPFTEGKEHLGGFTLVDVPDLDAALHWAGRMTSITTLPMEVRPLLDAPS